MKLFAFTISLALIPLTSIAAEAPKSPNKSPSEVLEQSTPNEWHTINPDNLLINTLSDGTQFIVYLNDFMPQVHTANIKNLANSRWFDKAKIVRVQDNYVVQWGREEGTEIPNSVIKQPPAEYEFTAQKYRFKPLKYRDTYAAQVGFVNSWAVAGDGKNIWLPHCYSMVGVGRDMAPDVGTGQELYVVIGHSPRHLDRNITTVGRIIDGMENLSARKRGSGQMGFYENDAEKIAFKSSILASQLPENERPKYEIIDTNSKSFDAYINARANRGGPFFIKPAGAVDICNSLPPIRKAK